VSQAPWSFDSAVLAALLIHLKRIITSQKIKKIKMVLGHFFWDQEELFSYKKNQHKESRDTVPLNKFKRLKKGQTCHVSLK